MHTKADGTGDEKHRQKANDGENAQDDPHDPFRLIPNPPTLTAKAAARPEVKQPRYDEVPHPALRARKETPMGYGLGRA
ncbi:hypothetical protein GCM10011317_28820 [Niveispirillum cyanobacteriorum]|nr:hypothetical protein GCM10011317_28820 [Niveispirillum cyanobacteriorum]